MYLKPGEGREPMHGAAVRLLHCHGASLDPLKVLEVRVLTLLSRVHSKCGGPYFEYTVFFYY
jgi:hypothetical protein